MKSKLKFLIVSLTCFTGSSVLQSQTAIITFGSTFEIDGLDFPSLYFASSDDTRFSANLGEEGFLAIGFFSNFGLNITFSDWLNDFTFIGGQEFTGSGLTAGYQTVTVSTAVDYSAETPFVFLFGGINDFSIASNATEFAIFGDSSFEFVAPSSPIPGEVENLILTPDNIVIGNFNSEGIDFELSTVVIPEPSTYAAIFGLGVLGFVMLRRRMTK